jgi:hypothetical protein
MELLVGILSGLNPVTSLFVFIAAAEAVYIVNNLRKQTEEETELRKQLDTLQQIHADTIKALQNDRIDDLKDLVGKYDATTKQITSALKRLGKDKS